MKTLLTIFIIVFMVLPLSAEGVNWHTMSDLAVIPVQILLDQRECVIQDGDSPNMTYGKGRHLIAKDFYIQLLTYKGNKNPDSPSGK
ncbi:MAG: hypothetical protein U9Q91_06975 [Candidatus Marinimicrobia bacterium]|nr:hypothetical protein [Candidatus Neomarinimicrobiota bacterium]